MRGMALLVVVIAGLVAEGCGGSSSGGTGGAGGQSGKGGTGGAGGSHTDASVDGPLAMCGTTKYQTSGVSCNTIEANGPCVTETLGTGAPPAATGGTIVAGTYDLVASTAYRNADAGADASVAIGSPWRQTTVVGGSGTALTFEGEYTSGTVIERTNGTVSPSGNSLTLTPTCPLDDAGNNGAATMQYTSTTTSTQTTILVYDAYNIGYLRIDAYLKR
jgi:hypothetical protein